MSIKQQIDQDLKTALLAGDKQTATVLRGLKGAVLNVEIAQNMRDQGLPETEVITVLAKEAKKRQESADMYGQAGQQDRVDTELAEKLIIEKYLPQQLSDDDLAKIIDQAIAGSPVQGMQAMGQIIGKVKAQTAGQADGGRIAALVKEKLA